MLIRVINCSQEVKVAVWGCCNWIELRTISKVGYNFKCSCRSVFWSKHEQEMLELRALHYGSIRHKLLACRTHLLLSELRASNSCRDLKFALARKRHITLSWVKHHISIRRYGTGPRQFLPPPLPALLELVTTFSPCCCCCALLATSCSLATSLVRNSISSTSLTGLSASHSSVWPLVQLLGRSIGAILKNLAFRVIACT